jgi:anti-sigma regulatory factor (Ser/Thr protein kinase)
MAAVASATPGDAPDSGTHSTTIVLEESPASVRQARDYVRHRLLAEGRPELMDTALLVVSELVTNALTHARPPVSVQVLTCGQRLRVEVNDHLPSPPTPRQPKLTAPGGRGLPLVAALTAQWGVTPTATGKTVWAEIDHA